MNDRKPGMFAPALIGGAVAGVLSGLPFLNCLCCCWIIGGAALASFLLAKDSPVSLTSGDGAVVGALAGITAAVISALIELPFRGISMAFMRRMVERMSEFSDQMPSGWESWLNRSSGGLTLAMFLMSLFFSAAVFAALGALGGVIGASLFGKKNPLPPAEIPPSQAA